MMNFDATSMNRKLRLVAAATILSITSSCAALSDRIICRTLIDPPYDTDPAAAQLHRTLTVVDLHADTLLWNRDLLQRASHGHVDLPRLQEGNVALQVFGVVNGLPFPLKMENNRDGYDITGSLASWQGWPKETHDSRLQRSLFQAEKLADRVKSSNGALKIITSRQDMEAVLAARGRGEQVIGAMLSLEGVQALEGDSSNFEQLFDAGFRMIGLVHLFDNEMAGSVHGQTKHGLTAEGRRLIQRMLDRGIVIDLAHASPQTMSDVLDMYQRPVIASHGGVRGTCDSVRNLADEHIHAIAATGGVIGIGLYEYATCGKTLEDTVRAMRYVIDLVGVEHVALGSDFDGSAAFINASGLAMLTETMLKAGFTETEISAIMGGNALRVFRQILPDQ
jgi:microsomal dipeptidase-like Zn-dependent dipeptidase